MDWPTKMMAPALGVVAAAAAALAMWSNHEPLPFTLLAALLAGLAVAVLVRLIGRRSP